MLAEDEVAALGDDGLAAEVRVMQQCVGASYEVGAYLLSRWGLRTQGACRYWCSCIHLWNQGGMYCCQANIQRAFKQNQKGIQPALLCAHDEEGDVCNQRGLSTITTHSSWFCALGSAGCRCCKRSCRPWAAPTRTFLQPCKCCTPGASSNQRRAATWQVSWYGQRVHVQKQHKLAPKWSRMTQPKTSCHMAGEVGQPVGSHAEAAQVCTEWGRFQTI
eukprot:scaffold62680_cov17-Tisochrysis_lutea.AAC.2